MSLVSPPPLRRVSLPSSLSLIASSSCRTATERAGARSVRSSSSPDRAPSLCDPASDEARFQAATEEHRRRSDAAWIVDHFDARRVVACVEGCFPPPLVCVADDEEEAAAIALEHNAARDVAATLEAEFAAFPIDPVDLPDDFEYGQFVDWNVVEARRAGLSWRARLGNAILRSLEDAGTAGLVALATILWLTAFLAFGALLHVVPFGWLVGAAGH